MSAGKFVRTIGKGNFSNLRSIWSVYVNEKVDIDRIRFEVFYEYEEGIS